MECKIENNVLLSCKGVTNTDVVDIPEGVEAIGDYVFSQANFEVETLRLPSSLKSIGDSAFSGLLGLKKIEVSSRNKYFYVKDDCLIEKSTNTLIFVTTKCEKIPECEIIANWGARNICTVNTIEIPKSIKTIGKCAFRGASFHNIVFPEKSPQIGPCALADCHNLKFVTLPKDMTVIPHHMFYNDESLRYIELPNTLEVIDHCAFYNSGLSSLAIPSSVKYIADSIVSDEYSSSRIDEVAFEDIENWYLCSYEKSYEKALLAAQNNQRKPWSAAALVASGIDPQQKYNIVPADVTNPQNNAILISWYDLKYMVKK